MTRAPLLFLIACSSSSTSTPTTPVAPPPRDAAVADAPPDAPSIDPAITAAPAWVFRFQSPDREETWTLQHANGGAFLRVEYKNGNTTQYTGTATEDGKKLSLALAAGPAKMSLSCMRDKLPVASATAKREPNPKKKTECRWAPVKTTSVEVLACKHPDFAAPMMFGAAPGIVFLTVAECTPGGYRAL